MKMRKPILVFAVLVLLTSTSFALDVSLSVENSNIWFAEENDDYMPSSQEVVINWGCDLETNETLNFSSITIIKSSGTESIGNTQSVGNNSFTTTLNIPNYNVHNFIGQNNVNITCHTNSQTKKKTGTFLVNSLELDILSPTSSKKAKVSEGGMFELAINLNQNPSSLTVSPDIIDIIIVDDAGYENNADILGISSSGGGKYNITTMLPKGILCRGCDIKVRVHNPEGKETKDQEYGSLNIVSPLRTQILGIGKNQNSMGQEISYTDSGKLVVKVTNTFRDEPIDPSKLTKDNFQVALKSEEEDQYSLNKYISSVECGVISKGISSSECLISINLPYLNKKGVYDLLVYHFFNGYQTYAELRDGIKFSIPFEGQLLNAKNNAVDGSIVFKGEKDPTANKVEIGDGGRYSTNLMPDNYTMSLSFGNTFATLNGVYIEEEIKGGISYDEPSNMPDIKGLNPASVTVLELSRKFSFSKGAMKIVYNAQNILNEKKLEVYTCKNWNFDRRECAESNWERIQTPIIDVAADLVEFDIPGSDNGYVSAFVVGERSALNFDVTIPKKRYSMNEPIQVEGKILDANGNYVSDAKISMTAGNFTNTFTTNSQGYFQGSVNAPPYPGSAKLHLEVKKDPYLPTEDFVGIEVYSKKELTFLLPEMKGIRKGTKQTINLTILNSGQTTLEGVVVSVDGIPNEWYTLTKDKIDKIEPNEKIKIPLEVSVSQDYCEVTECKKFYMINLNAENEQTSESGSFTLKLADEGESATGNNADSMTGKVTGEPTDVVKLVNDNWLIISIVIVFVFGLLILRKKGISLNLGNISLPNSSKRKNTQLPRNNRMSKLKKYKSSLSNDFKYDYEPEKK